MGSATDMATPLRHVVGARLANQFEDKLKIVTVGGLLRHYPRKYDKRGDLTDISKLKEGEKVTVWGTVRRADTRYPGPGSKVRSITKVTVSDGKTDITCTFFNQPWMSKQLSPGTNAMFAGTVGKFNGESQLSSPQVMIVGHENDTTLGDPDLRSVGRSKAKDQLATIEEFPGGSIPVYPVSEGISISVVQSAVRMVLDQLDEIHDPLPSSFRELHDLVGLDSALRNIHRPQSDEDLEKAKKRLRYDEALSVQLVLARRRELARQYPAEPCPPRPDGLLAAFDKNLPFTLTAGQQGVGEEITKDLSTIHPMNRLLQGEVGSGKTVVALRAMLQVIDNGRQAVLLAPTEVLAAQHARSLRHVLGPYARGGELGAPPEAIAITLLTGSMTAKAKRQALLDIVSGQAGIAVGTHALLSEGVYFAGLGLIVIDEQHRFGVEQRNVLRQRHPEGNPPHVLVMTATPIPRTVAMTVYGDLEVSNLIGLPRGRSPIATTAVPAKARPGWVDRAWERVHEEVGKGHQVYIVCPRIGDDDEGEDDGETHEPPDENGEEEKRPPLAVLAVARELAEGPLHGLRIGILHGRMPPTEKDAAMRAFTNGETEVLVSTTVIEVGVDVPNATMMVVLDAERFGMSQLHQLRGRVGRGSAPGICLLITEYGQRSPAMQRLEAVASTLDGFELAERDLELRREGNVIGTSQSGNRSGLRQLVLKDHRETIELARVDATRLVDADPSLALYPGLADMVRSLIGDDQQDFLEMG
ncbi:ATP-dependent DNA helicase RecG [Nakamurella alba]|nr:ATP-dependent DNA helicase RecG [Nakamurella alba]